MFEYHRPKFDRWWRWFTIHLFGYKYLEWQLDGPNNSMAKDQNHLVNLGLIWFTKQDHADKGISFGINNLFWCSLIIYDSRHWDYDNNCWKKYEQ